MSEKKPPFVHLHVHTEYSMLDGVNRISSLVEKVKNLGMNAVAMTDHGVMYGVYDFWNACREAKIKPLIGCEIYVSPGDRTVKEEIEGIRYYHLLLIAKNLQGYHNLIKIVSKAHLEGFYYKPRADRDLLQEYSEGIICTSACPASPLGKHIIRDEKAKAKDWLEFLNKTFKDNFYLELQRHGLKANDELPENYEEYDEAEKVYLKEQVKINTQLKKWSEEYKLPLIATTDAHYLNKEDELIQDVLLAIKDGKTLDDPNRMTAYKHTYIKTQEEMAETFKDVPQVMENTQKLADSVEEFDISYDRIQPFYPNLPEGISAGEELKTQAYEGAKNRYGELTDELKERIDYEISIIDDKDYSHYYLVTADYIQWARKNDIVVSMRGSGAASVVAYCLQITSLDPFWWDLMFERFLNPKRPSPPDFDLDLEDQNRDRVLNYVKEKYGEECVVAICTFGKLQTRAAIRDVSRVLGIDLSVADTLSKLVQVNFGKPKPISWMLENNAEFSSIVNSNPELQKMVDIVRKIEGQTRHLSTHACGVLITPQVVTDYIPTQKEIGGNRTITQLELNSLESLGLMKFDFLGLANLTIIKNTINLIKLLHGKEISVEDIPLDDRKTFEIFKKGDTTAVFQFESGGMKRFLRELKPDNIKDICFMAAAYRPGPMQLIPDAIAVKHGVKEAEYLLPELKPILEETYGAIVYQEQIMKIAVQVAGYPSYGDADLLRRAVAKKKKDVMAKEEPIFKGGMLKKGYTKEQADALWEYLLPFADYGFPKAHSAMYAVVAYWTAYLKAHYPLEFMCARLTSVMEHPDKLIVALEEARHMGLNLLAPNINKSHGEFTPEDKSSIRYGLNGIKNVGHNVVEEIVSERDTNGEFSSLDDLCARVKSINSRTLESLIKVGALNSFGMQNALLQVYQNVMSSTSKAAKSYSSGQLNIFNRSGSGDSDESDTPQVTITPLPQVDPVPVGQKLQWEKELLGIYFSSHPMQDVSDQVQQLGYQTIGKIDIKDNKNITAVAMISAMKKITTRKGDPMAFLTLEDMYKTVDGVLFPRDYEKYKEHLQEGAIIAVTGKGNLRNGEMSLLVNNIKFLNGNGKHGELDEELENKDSKQLQATLQIHHSATQDDLSNLREIMTENPGLVEVIIHILNNGKSRKFKLKTKVDQEIIDTIIAKLPLVENVIYTD